ncbi:MAG: IclR family transcriptional regulator [Acidobacteriota bacterium]
MKQVPVPSLERGLTALELLADSQEGLSISEMGRRMGCPKSSMHLILQTLERRGYVQRSPDSGRFRLGPKLAGFSQSVPRSLDLRRRARPFLLWLVQKTGLNAHLAVLERDEAVIADKVEAPGAAPLASWVGRRIEPHCTGVGKALLAFQPAEVIDRLLRPGRLTRHNPRTIVSVRALQQQLAEVRARGYAVDDQEDEVGTRCIGAPIFDAGGRVVAALGAAGMVAEIPDHRVLAVAALVREAAGRLSADLRGTPERSCQTIAQTR